MSLSAPIAPAKSLIVDSDTQRFFYIGIDVGGSTIKLGLHDSSGYTLAHGVLPTEPQRGAEDASQRIGSAVKRLIAKIGSHPNDVARAGLATPGTADIPGGRMISAGNLAAWRNFPIRDRVSQHAGMPVTYLNDANAAAYGEYWRGSGSAYHSMVLLTLGTGIGGGIIIGDTLIEGANGCGGECGHVIVDANRDAPKDALGKSGSLEAHVSAGALVARAVKAISSGVISSLATRHAAGQQITPRIIAEEAELGDALARDIVMEAAHWLAIGIASLVHTIDPEAVILGGAMTFGGAKSQLGREFLQRIWAEIRPHLLEPLGDRLHIEFASLESDAGYIGAAGMARLEHRELLNVSTNDTLRMA